MEPINVLSARAVALRGDLTVAEKRMILEMLGLVDIGGSEISPDDTKQRFPATMNRRGGLSPMKNPSDPRIPPKHSAAPAGLRASSSVSGDAGS